jgi:hypothetical protein
MIDLHLYMPMATFENHEKFLDEMKGILNCHQPSQSTWIRRAEPTKDEKRTILGCFNIFSCVRNLEFYKASGPLLLITYILGFFEFL